MRVLNLALAGLLTAFLLVYGCLFLVDALAIEHKTRTERFDAVPTLHLDTDGGGKIRVVGDGGNEIRVEYRWREGLQSASVGSRMEGDRLIIDTDCPDLSDAFCQVSATVHVPRGTALDGGGESSVEVVDVGGTVDVAVDDGSVRIDGARGDVQVQGSNGSITVADSTGRLVLHTDNGRIETERAEARTVDARTDNGHIELDLAEPPGSVVARSDNGSITVLVPRDGTRYRTNLSSDNGGIDDPIDTSPRANSSIDASTDNGSISVRYRPQG